MSKYLIMCRSLTYAQRAAHALENAGLTAAVSKAPQYLTTGGCAYAVSLHKGLEKAVSILNAKSLPYGKLYSRQEDGGYQEVLR